MTKANENAEPKQAVANPHPTIQATHGHTFGLSPQQLKAIATNNGCTIGGVPAFAQNRDGSGAGSGQ
jgi:hypothetical protein